MFCSVLMYSKMECFENWSSFILKLRNIKKLSCQNLIKLRLKKRERINKLVEEYVRYWTLNSMTKISWSGLFLYSRSSHSRSSIKKLFLKIGQYSLENICAGVKSAQLFSSEYCEIFRNTYFEENLQTAASILL